MPIRHYSQYQHNKLNDDCNSNKTTESISHNKYWQK